MKDVLDTNVLFEIMKDAPDASVRRGSGLVDPRITAKRSSGPGISAVVLGLDPRTQLQVVSEEALHGSSGPASPARG